VDHIQFVCQLGDNALVAWAWSNVHGVLDIHVAKEGDRGPLPVFAALPQEPIPVRIMISERVSAQADRRIECVRQGVLLLFEDVLGHNEARAPTHSEASVEARVGFFQVEDHGISVGLFHMVDIGNKQATPQEPRILHLDIDRIVQVIRCKLDAIAPVDALAQLDRHRGEVFIIDRLLGGQGIIPYAGDARIRVDVPQRIQRQLLKTG